MASQNLAGSNSTSYYSFPDQATLTSMFDNLTPFSIAVLSVKAIPCIFVAYYALWVVYTRTFHPLAKFPGPFLASISHIWIIKDMLGQKSDVTQVELHKKHGKIVRITPEELIINDPQAISIIYGIKKGFVKTDFWEPLGAAGGGRYEHHVSVVNELQHATRRRIVNGLYSMTNILKSEEYINVCLNELSRHFDRFVDSGEAIDLGKWSQLFSFDVIGELYFSKMFGFMADANDHENLIHSIDTMMPYITISQVAPRWIRPLIMSTSLFSGARQAAAGLQNLAVQAKAAVEERSKLLEDGVETRPDILGQLFGIYREKGEKLDYNLVDIQQECQGAILAGSDTTGTAINAILYYLLKHPQILKKLVVELDSASESGTITSPYPTYAEALKLPYLHACCREGMRYYPSAALHLPRHVPAGGMEIAGEFIPGGTRVGMNPAVVMRSKEVFGVDADEFNPERWFRPDAQNMDRYMFQFGAGSRTCLGKNIALAEIYKFVPYVLRNFVLKLTDQNAEAVTVNYGFHKFVRTEIKVQRR